MPQIIRQQSNCIRTSRILSNLPASPHRLAIELLPACPLRESLAHLSMFA